MQHLFPSQPLPTSKPVVVTHLLPFLCLLTLGVITALLPATASSAHAASTRSCSAASCMTGCTPTLSAAAAFRSPFAPNTKGWIQLWNDTCQHTIWARYLPASPDEATSFTDLMLFVAENDGTALSVEYYDNSNVPCQLLADGTLTTNHHLRTPGARYYAQVTDGGLPYIFSAQTALG